MTEVPANSRKSGRMGMVSFAGAVLALIASPATADVQGVDPDRAIDADLVSPVSPSRVAKPAAVIVNAQQSIGNGTPMEAVAPGTTGMTGSNGTYRKDDLIGAAEGVFGKGAAGLAGVIEDILKKQGEPNAYIVGREGGGALVLGLRYGSGTLHHNIEGQRPVYWQGPSLGFDAGGNAAKAFVLVYNLYDSQDLYKRFGQGEGQAYFVGGFNVSYLRRGDVVMIPVRVGAGLRLGANVGVTRFTSKQKWLPF